MENLISLLHKILETKESKVKESLISEFQNIVWDNEILDENELVTELLHNLAYVMEFYIPDDKETERDSTDYGDEQLKEEIEDALRKIKEIMNN